MFRKTDSGSQIEASQRPCIKGCIYGHAIKLLPRSQTLCPRRPRTLCHCIRSQKYSFQKHSDKYHPNRTPVATDSLVQIASCGVSCQNSLPGSAEEMIVGLLSNSKTSDLDIHILTSTLSTREDGVRELAWLASSLPPSLQVLAF
ncbi:hypothetical protein M758_1G141400 [Ceratodon purpureus]|nr:hypothetical protein M758_1G141400 [Ceratodon purpureus]